MFNSVKKCGYVADNKTDGNGAEHGNDGRFVTKGEKSKSTKNAEKLSLNIWGNTAEVIKQATPIRSANSFSEARNILKNIEAIDFDLNEKKGTSILVDDNQMSPNPGCSLFYFTIAHEAPEVKSIAGLWQMIKQGRYV